MKRIAEDFIVTLFGAATSLVTAGLLYVIERYLHVSFYTWTFWFIIPAGAIFSGLAAATGYWAGYQLFNHRPSSLILINMVLVSISTFFVIHYLTYYTLQIDGRSIREVIPFSVFLQTLITHASLGFRLHGAPMGSTGELGGWGYAFAGLQILGFAVGGLIVYGYLLSQPYCELCEKYLQHQGAVQRATSDPAKLKEFMEGVTPLFRSRELQQAVELYRSFGDPSTSKDTHVRTKMALWRCRGCPRNFLRLTVSRRSGNSWTDVPALKQEAFITQPLTL